MKKLVFLPVLLLFLHALDAQEIPCLSSIIITNTNAQDDQNGICNDVLLTATITNGPAAYFIWTFGDGTTATTPTGSVLHYYDALDVYLASVTVVDTNGCGRKEWFRVAVKCQRCEDMKVDFSYSCKENCIPLYQEDPSGEKKLVGYSCMYDLFSEALASPGGQITSWKWVAGGSTISTQPNPTNVFITSSGTTLPFQVQLCLIVQDDKGCGDKYCEWLNMPCGGERPAPTVSGVQSEFRVDPNPSSGLAILRLSELWSRQDLHLSILNTEGRVVREIRIPAGDTDFPLVLSDLQSGLYVFSIRHNEGVATRKVVINN